MKKIIASVALVGMLAGSSTVGIVQANSLDQTEKIPNVREVATATNFFFVIIVLILLVFFGYITLFIQLDQISFTFPFI